jgi:hypothetical protein
VLSQSLVEYYFSWAYLDIGLGNYKGLQGLKNKDGASITYLLEVWNYYGLTLAYDSAMTKSGALDNHSGRSQM